MTFWHVIRGVGVLAIIYGITVFNRRFLRAIFERRPSGDDSGESK